MSHTIMLVQANVEGRTCVFAVVVAAEVIKTLFLKQTSGLSRDYDSSKPINEQSYLANFGEQNLTNLFSSCFLLTHGEVSASLTSESLVESNLSCFGAPQSRLVY